jgi:hypothetical protein
MSITLQQLIANPYLFTNYVHQEVDLPESTEFDEDKRDFYNRIEAYMASDKAQQAFQNVVEDSKNFGLSEEAQAKLSDEKMKAMHFQEAMDAVADEANYCMAYGEYQKAISDASSEKYRELTSSLQEGDSMEKKHIETKLIYDLRFFQEGLTNALDFSFGFAGLIPRLYKKLTGSEITVDLFKTILKKNLKLLNSLCGMQIEIFNKFKQQVMDISQKERIIHEEGFELKSNGQELGLVPKAETAKTLIDEVKKKILHLPAFGCPVLRVKYKKDNVPLFDRMHQWVEDLIDKHIVKNWENIMANDRLADQKSKVQL